MHAGSADATTLVLEEIEEEGEQQKQIRLTSPVPLPRQMAAGELQGRHAVLAGHRVWPTADLLRSCSGEAAGFELVPQLRDLQLGEILHAEPAGPSKRMLNSPERGRAVRTPRRSQISAPPVPNGALGSANGRASRGSG